MTHVYVAILKDMRPKSEFTYLVGVFSTENKALIALRYAKTNASKPEIFSGVVDRVKIDDINSTLKIETLEKMIDIKKGA